MRTLAKYSTPALAGLMSLAVACAESTAPDTKRLSTVADRSAEAKKSGPSQPDNTAPTVTSLSATEAGSRHIALAWAATDDRPLASPLYYSITINGAPDPAGRTWNTSRSYYMLEPTTTYTFTVQARDYSGNWSAPRTLAVTTRALDPNDTQAPTAPTNVGAESYFDGSTEFQLSWTASTDNVDPQSAIRYEVYVNGALENIVFGAPLSRSNYGVWGSNTVSVIAVDAAGNRSEAGMTTIVF